MSTEPTPGADGERPGGPIITYGLHEGSAPKWFGGGTRRNENRDEVKDMERVGHKVNQSHKWLLLSSILLAAPGCLSGLELGGSPGSAIDANMMPDPSYRTSVGDRAVLFGTGPDAPSDLVPVLVDLTAFDKYERIVKSRETFELTEMEQAGLLARTSNGTRVLVLSLKDRTHVGDRYAAEIRVLDGSLKDKTGWTPATLVTRLIPIEPQPQ